MDEALRQDLHRRLDEILDQRAAMEPSDSVIANYLQPQPSGECRDQAHTTWISMIELAKDILGDSVRAAALDRHYNDESEQRRLLQSWFLDLYPLLFASPQSILTVAPKAELTVFDVMDALSALDAGEIRPLFRANTGKNRRANRWSLGRAKLEALVWKKRLRGLGFAEKAANFEVTKAFGEQWDTIRKWKPQCEAILGVQVVASSLAYAGSPADYYMKSRTGGMFNALAFSPMNGLSTAGQAYRNEVQRSAELSKRKRGVV